MSEDILVKPGFFGLPLGLFRPEAYESLHACISNCQRKLHSRTHNMDVAIHNLLGMLYYSVRQVANSLAAFQRALEIDPDGLNALENIRHIYELLGRNKDAREAEQRVKDLLPRRLARARCLAEQGYAMSFGLVEDNSKERLQQSAKYFRDAIMVDQGKTHSNERANWYLCIAVNMQKICAQLFKERKGRETEYMECVVTCLEAYRLTKYGDTTLHAMALRLLGTLRSKLFDLDTSCKRKMSELASKYDASTYYANPEESFKKALKQDPQNPESYTRYAQAMTEQFRYDPKRWKESCKVAIDLLDRYIGKHESLDGVANLSVTDPRNDLWFPLVCRGRLYVKLYKYKHDVNVENLHKAYQDFTWALKIKRASLSLSELGEVCHLIAMHLGSEHEDYTKYMNEALTCFLDATMCLDGETSSYNHFLYARCLADYGEHRAAAESYKRALELNQFYGTALKGFVGLVQSLDQLYEENDRPKEITAELAFWLDYIVPLCKENGMLKDTLETMFQDHKHIMTKALHQLGQQNENGTLKFCLELYEDSEKATELKILLEQESMDEAQLSDTLSTASTATIASSKLPHMTPTTTTAPHLAPDSDNPRNVSSAEADQIDDVLPEIKPDSVMKGTAGPCDEHSTPIEDSDIAGEGSPSSIEGSAISGERTSISGDKIADPKEGSAVSGKGSTVSGEGSVVTRERSAISIEGSAVSGEGAAVSGEGAAVSGEGAAVSGEGSPISGEGAAVPREGSAVSGEGSAVSGEGSEVFGEGSILSGEGSGVSGEGSAVSGDVLVASGEESDNPRKVSDIPRKDPIASKDNSPVPSDSSTLPPERPAIPAEGSIHAAGSLPVVDEASNQSHSTLLQHIPPPLSQAKNQHGKTFDFFVSFSTKDAEWVYHSLLPKLEKQLKFRGCIADRDYILGKSIFDNMTLSFDQSVCTILVITQNFVDSSFCTDEIDQVLHRRHQQGHKVIPIKLKECDVPEKIDHLTYLDATCHMDWDRLRRDLDFYCNK